jgi:hypothetical protein
MKDECNDNLPGVNIEDPHVCAICNQPLDTKYQGTKPARIDGKVVFTDQVEMITCWTDGCAAWGITTTPHNYYNQLRAHKVLTNKPVIDAMALSFFQVDADAPIGLLDLERARAAIGQGGNS